MFIHTKFEDQKKQHNYQWTIMILEYHGCMYVPLVGT